VEILGECTQLLNGKESLLFKGGLEQGSMDSYGRQNTHRICQTSW